MTLKMFESLNRFGLSAPDWIVEFTSSPTKKNHKYELRIHYTGKDSAFIGTSIAVLMKGDHPEEFMRQLETKFRIGADRMTVAASKWRKIADTISAKTGIDSQRIAR